MMTKNIALILLPLLLTLPKTLQAGTEFNPLWTGLMSERLDTCGYACGQGHDGGYIGGPIANNSLGGAYQFHVLDQIGIDHLLVSADVLNDNPGSIEFNWKLYTSGEKYPDVNSLDLDSPMFVETIYGDNGELAINHYQDVNVPFNYTLNPGHDYWLARERDYGEGGPIVTNIQSSFVTSTHAPEPATWALFGLGGLGLLRRFKKA